MDRLWSKVYKLAPDACWPYTGALNSHGYGAFKLNGQMVNAHRVVYWVTHGVWPRVARHTCNYRPCCNPAHIIDGSHADNAADRSEAGSETGSKNGRAKLTEADIPTIRQLLAEGVSKREIGRRYGVSDVAIGQIASGKHWKHVP